MRRRSSTGRSGTPTVAVIGGAVAGLAAAERFREFADVTLFERQSYEDKRVNCGEAINEPSLVPLEKTPENGFVNDIDGFQLRVYEDEDHGPDAHPLGVADLQCEPGYVCDRNVVERRWAERLADRGVTVRDGPDANCSPAAFDDVVDEYDYVVDASGQPAWTMRALGRTDRYTGETIALNANVSGDFSDHVDRPRLYFEGYLGYAWSFPKSASRSNLGIGWASDDRPDDYMAAFQAACERNGLPVPDRAETNVYTIPRGPSLDPQYACLPDRGVYLVGDAAGIANRYQGEGICQAIRSSYLLADLVRRGEEPSYPKRLYDLLRSEYRLATLMRGVWEDHEDSELLARLAETMDGATAEEITRSPGPALRRVASRPKLGRRLLNRGMARRIVDAYTDTWEYDRA